MALTISMQYLSRKSLASSLVDIFAWQFDEHKNIEIIAKENALIEIDK